MNLRVGVVLVVAIVVTVSGWAAHAEMGILLPAKDRIGDPETARLVEAQLKIELGWNHRLADSQSLRNALRRLRIRDCDTATRSQLLELADELEADWLFSPAVLQGPTAHELQLTVSGIVYRPEAETIIWAGFESASGLDSRRVLGIETIDTISDLASVVVRRLVKGFDVPPDEPRPARLKRSRGARGYLSDQVHIGPETTVAVLPFDASTEGDAAVVADTMNAVALSVAHRSGLRVVSPHLVTDTLRRQGVLLQGEVSAPARCSLRSQHQVDLILTGNIELFESHRGPGGDPLPKLAFGIRMIDAESGSIVWIDGSHRTGWDHQGAFGTNRTYVAGALARETMEGLTAEVFPWGESRLEATEMVVASGNMAVGSPSQSAASVSERGPAGFGVAGSESSVQEMVWPPDVLATVNGEKISIHDLERSLEEVHGAVSAGHRSAFDIDRLMFKMVNDRLVTQEAMALGLHLENPVADQIRRYRDRLCVQLLEKEVVQSGVTVTDDEIQAVFEQRYRRVTLRVVTTADHEPALEVLADIRGGADMAQTARQRSIDPYTLRGGQVDDVRRMDLAPEIADLAFSLRPGELGGPIRTDLGWSVLRVESFMDADEEVFSKVQRNLTAAIRTQKAAEARSAFSDQLRDQYSVVIDEAAVESVKPRRLTDGRLAPDYDEADKVVVRIGPTGTITAGQFGKSLRDRWTRVRNEQAAVAAAPIVLRRMVEAKLMLLEARTRGFNLDEAVVQAVRTREIQLLVPRYFEEVVAPKIEVRPDELEAFFEEQTFASSQQARVGQMTVPTRGEGDRVAGMIRQGGDFAWFARQFSSDRFADRGGDRGWVSRGQGIFGDSLRDVAVGDIVGPFGVEGNYVLVEVRELRQTAAPTFEDVEEDLRRKLLMQKTTVAIRDLMTKLRARSDLRLNEAAIENLRIENSAVIPPQPGGGGGTHGG